MVTNVTSLTGNGLKDWLIQRVTAVYIGVYTLFLLGFFLAHPHMTYDTWITLVSRPAFQIASVLMLFTLILHAWIGIWTVTTDYIRCTAIRLTVQGLVVLFLLGQLVWGVMLVWGL